MSAVGMRLLRVLRPPGDRRRDERGRCSACGAETRFVFNSWLLPPDADDEWGEWAPEFARRETMICSGCSATLRVRRLADVLVEHYGQGAGCLAELVEEPGFRELDVAEVNSIGALHPLLARLPKLRYSEYGAGTVPSEDLTSLSYDDGSLDLVLTSETLEHVPDWQRALAETRRVLRPGGRHVFTVPLVPTRPATEDVERPRAGTTRAAAGRSGSSGGTATCSSAPSSAATCSTRSATSASSRSSTSRATWPRSSAPGRSDARGAARVGGAGRARPALGGAERPGAQGWTLGPRRLPGDRRGGSRAHAGPGRRARPAGAARASARLRLRGRPHHPCARVRGSARWSASTRRGRWSSTRAGSTKDVPNASFVAGSLDELEPASFDLAWSVLVLQHLAPDEVEPAIERLVALVRPGGAAVFQLPHATRPLHRLQLSRRGYRLLRALGVGAETIHRRTPLTPMRMTVLPRERVEAAVARAGGRVALGRAVRGRGRANPEHALRGHAVIRALRTPRGAAAAVALLVLVDAALRGWAAWLVPAPWFAGDEAIYSLLGQGLYREGKLAILGGPTGFFSLVWPAIAGLPLSLGDLGLGYRILRVFEPLLMSLAAIPAYLWARRVGAGPWALAAAALTLALPALGYSSFVMTEVVYYPLVTLALLAAAAMLERPTARRQALFAGALALAVLTRVQAIVLVPVVVTALVVEALLAREPRRALRLLPALVGLALLGIVYIAWKAAAGGSATGVLGGYSETAHGYRFGQALRFVLYHAADAVLLVAVAPACATALLVVGAVPAPRARRRRPGVPRGRRLALRLARAPGRPVRLAVRRPAPGALPDRAGAGALRRARALARPRRAEAALRDRVDLPGRARARRGRAVQAARDEAGARRLVRARAAVGARAALALLARARPGGGRLGGAARAAAAARAVRAPGCAARHARLRLGLVVAARARGGAADEGAPARARPALDRPRRARRHRRVPLRRRRLLDGGLGEPVLQPAPAARLQPAGRVRARAAAARTG